MTDKMLASLAHPVRLGALERIAQGPASPEQIATEIGADLGVVAYHVRILRREGLVVLDHVEPARGALRHVYRLGDVDGLADDVRGVGDAMHGLSVTLAGATT